MKRLVKLNKIHLRLEKTIMYLFLFLICNVFGIVLGAYLFPEWMRNGFPYLLPTDLTVFVLVVILLIVDSIVTRKLIKEMKKVFSIN